MHAAVVTWVGGVGNWEDDSNWDSGQVPNWDDGVVINSGTATLNNYAQANYVHLDGGNLDVVGTLYLTPDVGWYPNSVSPFRGLVVEEGSIFNNYGASLIVESGPVSGTGYLLYCDGEMTNHTNGFLFMQGDNCTGLKTYIHAETIDNDGEIIMSFVKSGMSLFTPFRNFGNIEIGCEDLAIENKENFYSAIYSTLETNGRIVNHAGATWNQFGDVEVHYTSSGTSSPVSMNGLFEIQNSGHLIIDGSHYATQVKSGGTLRVRGRMDIHNEKQFSSAISISGFMVNHQKGVISTQGYYGVNNHSGTDTRNFGTWYIDDPQGAHWCSLWNTGVFSNRPKGKLYIEGRLNLKPGSTFNNQGHMFVLDDYNHQDISAVFNNTGTLNDVHDRLGSISNNASYRVHKMPGPFTVGVPVSNILDKGSAPGASVLNFYTTPTGNVIAGTYVNATNSFTPNINSAGLTSLYVRTRINTGGVTRRHELIVENGINSNPSPLVQQNENADLYSNAELSIAPNPVQSEFSLHLKNIEPATFKYSIYSSVGQLESSGTLNANQSTVELPNFLPSGLYFLNVYDYEGRPIATEQIRVLR